MLQAMSACVLHGRVCKRSAIVVGLLDPSPLYYTLTRVLEALCTTSVSITAKKYGERFLTGTRTCLSHALNIKLARFGNEENYAKY
jgi:hypothetical protein